ncbi:gluconate transporter [Oscillatoria sp. FACHB-1407]|uniref:GntP family permease n=1 Tax=Oscillatoria sp. FACHB-1407 TaxID=2692847 RepID=UPI00168524D4|nr:SLC13 family permease [Oscillatoria sp. FACHB-1407]MBD2463153.1 gluconate transporter [Oscillatoria sp. FACHB-1407]
MSPGVLILIAALGIALLLFLVIKVRLQAFLALLIASLFVAIAAGIPLQDIPQTIQDGMGSTLGFIAIVVGIGTMFGEILRVSGGAERLATTLVGKFGEDKAPWALGLTGLIVSIPVFFDVGLIILIPLVYSLTQRTGRSLLYYALPLAAGLAIGHSYIPPTPGPVAVASLLGADLGWVILFGVIAGFPAMVIGGIFFGRYIASQINAQVPEYMLLENHASANLDDDEEDNPHRSHTAPDAQNPPAGTVATQERVDVEPQIDVAPQKPSSIPSFGVVLGLICIPLVLILLNTVSSVVFEEGDPIRNFLSFLGHPFSALLIATLLSFYLLGKRQGMSRRDIQDIATKSLEPVGLIILVTGAGGVFGKTLVATGVGEALANAMAATNLPLIALAFLIATAVRVSQGSATVAMVTTAGLVAPVVQSANLTGPILGLITIAIASGATVLSHVNDSGFWLVSRYLGISEKNTLRSWTVMETILGGVGFLVVLIISFFV